MWRVYTSRGWIPFSLHPDSSSLLQTTLRYAATILVATAFVVTAQEVAQIGEDATAQTGSFFSALMTTGSFTMMQSGSFEKELGEAATTSPTCPDLCSCSDTCPSCNTGECALNEELGEAMKYQGGSALLKVKEGNKNGNSEKGQYKIFGSNAGGNGNGGRRLLERTGSFFSSLMTTGNS